MILVCCLSDSHGLASIVAVVSRYPEKNFALTSPCICVCCVIGRFSKEVLVSFAHQKIPPQLKITSTMREIVFFMDSSIYLNDYFSTCSRMIV